MRKKILIHLTAIAAIAAYYLTLYLCDITCPILALIGYPCPTCGMSRAVGALFTDGIAAYCQLNLFALPCATAALLLIHAKLFKHKKLITIAAAAVFAANIVYYACRLAFKII